MTPAELKRTSSRGSRLWNSVAKLWIEERDDRSSWRKWSEPSEWDEEEDGKDFLEDLEDLVLRYEPLPIAEEDDTMSLIASVAFFGSLHAR